MLLLYGRGELDRDQRHRMEDHFLDCPLCAIALEGISAFGEPPAALYTPVAMPTPRAQPASIEAVAESLLCQGEAADESVFKLQPELPLGSTSVGAARGEAVLRAIRTEEATKAAKGGNERRLSRRALSPSVAFSIRRVAAGVLLCFLLAGLYFNYQRATRPERLFAEFFFPNPSQGYQRVRGLLVVEPELDIFIQQALHERQQGDYQAELTAWQAYFEAQPSPEDFRPYLYAATAALASGRDAEADFFLREMTLPSQAIAREEVAWYRALLALKQGDLAAATEALEALANAAVGEYGKQLAPELLRRL
ncbi:MAG: hypothetical protein HC821_05310 [Lewinella sp.]|nr:hypothetical protein [Lewinella sp.]